MSVDGETLSVGAKRLQALSIPKPEKLPWRELGIKNYGIDVNLFVDHSQIVQLECLRAGIWGTQDTWGRMLSYGPRSADEDSPEQ